MTGKKQLLTPEWVPITITLFVIFSAKALVQVREGLALLIAMAALYPLATKRSINLLLCAAILIVATGLHISILSTLLLLFISIFSGNLLSRKHLYKYIATLSLAFGTSSALLISANAGLAVQALSDQGIIFTENFESSWQKIGYWAAQGVVIYTICRTLLSASQGIANKHGRLFCVGISLCLLPFSYAIAAALTLLSFPYADIISLFLRSLYTSTEVALIMILWRGHFGGATLAASVLLILDRLRLLSIAVGL